MRQVCYASVILLTVAGLALAQAPQGTPPGRGGFAPIVIGPVAPVPPEVAIPRPTPAELEQINLAVKNWIAADESSAKPLLKRYGSLLTLQPPRLDEIGRASWRGRG